MDNAYLRAIINNLLELKEDIDMGTCFKERTGGIVALLQENSSVAIKKALTELEELSSLQTSSYQRMQIWDVMGQLETLLGNP